MSEDAVVAEGLTRSFRVRKGADRVALDHLDLRLPVGGVHGLLGPNGAGKTTLCRVASTVLLPTSGSLRVLGRDVVSDAAQVRRSIGIVFGGDRGLYGRLTARENLEFWCAMYAVPGREVRPLTDRLLGRLGLAARAGDRVETFSRGMKQRLHLARGLVADPPVLLLDEPTVGMDPVSAHDFRALMGDLRGEGRTVLLTTHDMAEAQALCDTVTFIDGGRIVGSGTPATLRALSAGEGLRVRVHDVDAATHERLVTALPPGASSTHDAAARLTDVSVADAQRASAVVAAALGVGCDAVTTGPPSLEDVYLAVLGTRGGGVEGVGERGMDVS